MFSALEKILPDVVRWVSIFVEGGKHQDDAVRVAIGATGLISVGIACFAAKTSERPYRNTITPVLLAVILTGHALVKSSEDSNGSPDLGDVSGDLYIVLVFLVLYLLVFRNARGGHTGLIGKKVMSTGVGAAIGFSIGMVLVLAIDYVLPDIIHSNVRYIVQPQATIALAVAWGMAMLPIHNTRISTRDILVFVISAVILGFGYGLLAYSPDWFPEEDRTVAHRLILGSITMFLTLPSIVTSIALTGFGQSGKNGYTDLTLFVLVGVLCSLIAILFTTVIPLTPLKTGIDTDFIRNLLIMSITVLPLLTAIGVQLGIRLENSQVLIRIKK